MRTNPRYPKSRVWTCHVAEPGVLTLSQAIEMKLNELEKAGQNIFSVNLDSYPDGVRGVITAWYTRGRVNGE